MHEVTQRSHGCISFRLRCKVPRTITGTFVHSMISLVAIGIGKPLYQEGPSHIIVAELVLNPRRFKLPSGFDTNPRIQRSWCNDCLFLARPSYQKPTIITPVAGVISTATRNLGLSFFRRQQLSNLKIFHCLHLFDTFLFDFCQSYSSSFTSQSISRCSSQRCSS
jgi:hypothetical protein